MRQSYSVYTENYQQIFGEGEWRSATTLFKRREFSLADALALLKNSIKMRGDRLLSDIYMVINDKHKTKILRADKFMDLIGDDLK
jgi:hypothetical protein